MTTRTKHNEHRGARLLALVGVLLGTVYLGWRLLFSLHGTQLWLSVPALVVDVATFGSTAVLVWALWPAEGMTEAARRVRSGLVTPVFLRQPVDVVVRVGDQSAHEVRATLLGLQRVQRIGRVVLLDMHGREWIEQLASEFKVRHLVPDDRNGLRAICSAVRTPEFLLLEAGDVAPPDIVEALGAEGRGATMPPLQIITQVREGIREAFTAAGGAVPPVDREDPKVVVVAYLERGRCTLCLDTSGKSLHKRGYRAADVVMMRRF